MNYSLQGSNCHALNEISWKKIHQALLPNIAPHDELSLTLDESKKLLKAYKAYLIRWTSDFDCDLETPFWYVIKDHFGGLEELKKNMRNQIRKSLKNCTVKQVDNQFIADNGYPVYAAAFSEYNTFAQPWDENDFRKKAKKLTADKGWEFWAVFSKTDNLLIGYAQNRVFADICNYDVIKWDRKYKKLYPIYALIHEMNRYYLKERALRYVNDGARSINHDTNIQDFLIKKFNFRRAYCRLHVHYAFSLKIFTYAVYPFRKIIRNLNWAWAKRLSVLLKLEECRRSLPK